MERLSRIDMIINMLKSEPNDLFLNYTLGLEYVAELSLQDAEFQFKKTLEINVDYIPAFYQLGKLFESQLKNTEALHYFKLGLEQAKSQKNNKISVILN